MSRNRRKGGAARQSPTPDTRHLTPRAALTLVELLITILIIGILASAVLGVAAVANQSARESRTRIMIARLHTLVNEQHDTYKSRRVKVRPEVISYINGQNASQQVKNRNITLARLYALRELMLMEIPQRWSDVMLRDLSAPATEAALFPQYLDAPLVSDPPHATRKTGRTPLAKLYLRHLRRIASSTNKFSGSTNTVAQIEANQGAECLYLFVMNACGDGEARSLFPESMIGDTDGDGALEFLDGWGRPIEFLRWAPGFNSEIQANAVTLGTRPQAVNENPIWEELAARDHDPFDIQRVEISAFRLVPLIYSTGSNGDHGIQSSDLMNWPGIDDPTQTFPGFNGRHLSPYIRPTAGTAQYAGEILEPVNANREAAVDNIHNHLISMKPRR